MRINRWILFSAVTAAVLAVAFNQLSLRAQGRIVEFCSLGEWPLEWAVRKQFERKQPELRSITEFAAEAPEIAGLSVTPFGLRARLRDNQTELQSFEKPDILQALISIEAQLVNMEEDYVSVFLGSEVRGSTNFEASYIYPLASVDMPDCEAIVAKERAKIGGCGFRLNSRWYAKYSWYPDDIEELEKALGEVK